MLNLMILKSSGALRKQQPIVYVYLDFRLQLWGVLCGTLTPWLFLKLYYGSCELRYMIL